jgi:hypothetical protein
MGYHAQHHVTLHQAASWPSYCRGTVTCPAVRQASPSLVHVAVPVQTLVVQIVALPLLVLVLLCWHVHVSVGQLELDQVIVLVFVCALGPMDVQQTKAGSPMAAVAQAHCHDSAEAAKME